MRWSEIPFSPPHRLLRQFAGLWLVAFGGLAVWEALARGRPAVAAALAAVAVTVGGLGLIRPGAVRPIFVGWMVLAFPVGWLVSHTLLALVFFGVFLPVGVAFRLLGRDALRLRPQPGMATYWAPTPAPGELRRYFRQY
jgi:hypothetical protein